MPSPYWAQLLASRNPPYTIDFAFITGTTAVSTVATTAPTTMSAITSLADAGMAAITAFNLAAARAFSGIRTEPLLLLEELEMKRIFFVCTCLGLACAQSILTVRESSGGFTAPQQKPKTTQQKSKPAQQKPKATQPKPKPKEGDLNLLSMEIKALETLQNFKPTIPQLQQIARIAKTTKAKAEKLEPAQAGGDYAAVLKKLRDALTARDEDAIEKLQEQLANIEEKNPPKLDNEFDITDAARKEAESLFMKLSPRQLVIYADSFGDDLPDPVEVILQGVKETRSLKGKEWEEARDDLADEMSWLLAGVGGNLREKIRADVSVFLNGQHGKSSSENELKARIQHIVGNPDPLILLKNLLKHDLALLLSNPQLEKAVQELLNRDKSKI